MKVSELDHDDQTLYEIISQLGHARRMEINKKLAENNITNSPKWFDRHIPFLIKGGLIHARGIKNEKRYYAEIPAFAPTVDSVFDAYIYLEDKLPDLEKIIVKNMRNPKRQKVMDMILNTEELISVLRVILKFKKPMNTEVFAIPQGRVGEIFVKHSKDMFPPSKERIGKQIEDLEKIEKRIVDGLEFTNPKLYIEIHNLLTKRQPSFLPKFD